MKRLSVISLVLVVAGCGSGVLDPEASRTTDARSVCRDWFSPDGVFDNDMFDFMVTFREAQRNDRDLTEADQIDTATAECLIACDTVSPSDVDWALWCVVECQTCNAAIISEVYDD